MLRERAKVRQLEGAEELLQGGGGAGVYRVMPDMIVMIVRREYSMPTMRMVIAGLLNKMV